MERHISGECLDIHKVYIIGRQILESDLTVYLTFANGLMLLNMFRSIASGICFDLSLRAAAHQRQMFGHSHLHYWASDS